MKYIWIIFIFFLTKTTNIIDGVSVCDTNNHCKCYKHSKNNFEYQCPMSTLVDILENNKTIKIHCNGKIKPKNLPLNLPEATELQIQHCEITPTQFDEILEQFNISKLTTLYFINTTLSKNGIQKEYFKTVPMLKKLILEDCGLTRLEKGVFSKLPLLQELNLARNDLNDISDKVFENMSQLNYLNLKQNNLSFLSKNVFNGLTNLSKVDLSLNTLKTIPEGLFDELNNLEYVYLQNNALGNKDDSLPKELFKNMLMLKEVDLRNCNLKTIPNDLFLGDLNLEIINLSGNKLRKIHHGLFRGLNRLKKLYLKNNQFEDLEELFKKLNRLVELNLEGNSLKRIGNKLFKDLTQLEVLNLSNNNISYIDSEAFQNCRSLLTINMANNECSLDIDLFMGGILDNSVNIETIDFSHNKITDVNQVITINTRVHWKNLDFSYNDISAINIQDLKPLNPQNAIINLEHNKIHHVNFENVETLSRTNEVTSSTQILLSHNPLTCDCLNYDLLRFLKGDLHSKVYDMFNIKVEDVTCSQPEDTNGILFDKLRLIDVTCPANQLSSSLTCPNDCQCLARPYDKTYIVNCSNLNLTDYPQFKFNINRNINQIELHLESNNFTRSPNRSEVEWYSHVTKLYLSNNHIKKIEDLPRKLHTLALDHNNLSRLSDSNLEKLLPLKNVSLHHNPWECDCDMVNFLDYLDKRKDQINTDSMFCANSARKIIDSQNLCKEDKSMLIIFPTLVFLLVFATSAATYYRYQNEIKVWLFAKHLCLWWVSEEELDKDKIYDAFISYAHQDEDFIVKELLPVLEGGPTPYKLCLHYRDWTPGEMITVHVTNSVLESRRTVIVMSQSYLKSAWGKHEFRTAHSQAMMDGRARVIMILYGDINVDSLDEELKVYLRTNTYVKWGDPYFWNKLRYALPHSTRRTSIEENVYVESHQPFLGTNG